MIPLKRWVLLPLTALACLAFLSACGEDEADTQEQEQQAQITRELAQSENLHPNTQVNFSHDDKGNLQFSYENPDGSGGGGVALD